MITSEQDSDVVRWGLQLFEGDPYSNCAYYGSLTQNNADYQNNVDYYDDQYLKEEQYDVECNDVENDELIAHALQEELSQLAVAEAPGSPHEGVGNLQAPYYSHDWLGQSMENYSYGIEEPKNASFII